MRLSTSASTAKTSSVKGLLTKFPSRPKWNFNDKLLLSLDFILYDELNKILSHCRADRYNKNQLCNKTDYVMF